MKILSLKLKIDMIDPNVIRLLEGILLVYGGGVLWMVFFYFIIQATGSDDRDIQKKKDDLQKQIDQVLKR